MNMKKYFLLITLSAGISFSAAAQKKTVNYKFGSINSIALLNGENSTAAALQTVNGFGKNKWFAGIGLGLDYYLYRSIPVFADVRREFGKKRNKFFAYADAGMNIQWVQSEFEMKPVIWNPNLRNKFHNGIYTDAGFGFSVGMKNNQAFILSLGHSMKTMKETRGYTDWRTGQPTEDIYKFNFSRVVLKFGWRF